MDNIFSTIGQAWSFFQKQPVLNHVALWLIALPSSVMISLAQLQEWHPLFVRESNFDPITLPMILLVFAQLLLTIILLWGAACTLLVCKKILRNSAGRTRSSFKKVRQEAGVFVVQLFLTDILRSCFILLWGLLLIIPGIIYAIRTFFYQVAIICEGKQYRDALQQSKNIVTGQTWKTLLILVGLSIILYLPVAVGTGILTSIIIQMDSQLLLPANIITAGLWSIATIVFTIASVYVYKNLQEQSSNLPQQIVTPIS